MKEITDNLLISRIRVEGKLTFRSPMFESSGTFDGCYLYKGKLYDCRVSWGWLKVFELEKSDMDIGYPDIEKSHRSRSRIRYTRQIYDELLG